MATNFDPAVSAYSRVFLIEGRARPSQVPTYESCVRAGAADYPFGEVTSIKCPDPNVWGKFVEQGELSGEDERPTTDIMGRYAMDIASTMLKLAKKKCSVDVHFHYGKCTNPSSFNEFKKAMIWENVKITNWSTDELGALEPGDNSPVNETAALSAEIMYEVLPITTTAVAASIVTNEVLDVIIADAESCGDDCDTESDGCEKIYAITTAAGGSPGTSADIVHSIDKGNTWYADDIDTLGAAEAPNALAHIGLYIVVVSEDSESHHYALKTEIDDVDYDEAWAEVTTGYVAGNGPQDIDVGDVIGFIVGENGYVYKCEDPTSLVTVLDAGVATAANLNAVSALTDLDVLAAGNAGAIIYSTDGATFQSVTPPVGVGVNINCCLMKSTTEWFIGCNDGSLYYTENTGTDWTLKQDFGAAVHAIKMSTDSVMWVAVETATPRGQIRRSFDGGYSWTIIPEGTTTIPVNDRINALGVCPQDPNFVVGVGLADDGADGYIVVGED